MRVAYLDTSWLMPIALGEAGHDSLLATLEGYDRVYSAGLLEAELWSVCAREGIEFDPDLLSGLRWVLPDRPLSRELGSIFSAGHLKGADAWHVACALLVADVPPSLTFLTLDLAQAQVARALGFTVPAP